MNPSSVVHGGQFQHCSRWLQGSVSSLVFWCSHLQFPFMRFRVLSSSSVSLPSEPFSASLFTVFVIHGGAVSLFMVVHFWWVLVHGGRRTRWVQSLFKVGIVFLVTVVFVHGGGLLLHGGLCGSSQWVKFLIAWWDVWSVVVNMQRGDLNCYLSPSAMFDGIHTLKLGLVTHLTSRATTSMAPILHSNISPSGESYVMALGGMSISVPHVGNSSKVEINSDTMSVQLNEKAFEGRLVLCQHSSIARVVLSKEEKPWKLADLKYKLLGIWGLQNW